MCIFMPAVDCGYCARRTLLVVASYVSKPVRHACLEDLYLTLDLYIIYNVYVDRVSLSPSIGKPLIYRLWIPNPPGV